MVTDSNKKLYKFMYEATPASVYYKATELSDRYRGMNCFVYFDIFNIILEPRKGVDHMIDSFVKSYENTAFCVYRIVPYSGDSEFVLIINSHVYEQIVCVTKLAFPYSKIMIGGGNNSLKHKHATISVGDFSMYGDKYMRSVQLLIDTLESMPKVDLLDMARKSIQKTNSQEVIEIMD